MDKGYIVLRNTLSRNKSDRPSNIYSNTFLLGRLRKLFIDKGKRFSYRKYLECLRFLLQIFAYYLEYNVRKQKPAIVHSVLCTTLLSMHLASSSDAKLNVQNIRDKRSGVMSFKQGLDLHGDSLSFRHENEGRYQSCMSA